MDDKMIEAWMGQMQVLLKQNNQLLQQHNQLIGTQNKKLAQLQITLAAGARTPVTVETAPPSKEVKVEATHVEQACPACGHSHVWDLVPNKAPGQHYADREGVINTGAFLASQMCEKCDTPLTTVVHKDRAQQPVVSVSEMYGLKPDADSAPRKRPSPKKRKGKK